VTARERLRGLLQRHGAAREYVAAAAEVASSRDWPALMRSYLALVATDDRAALEALEREMFGTARLVPATDFGRWIAESADRCVEAWDLYVAPGYEPVAAVETITKLVGVCK
jgi:hypothetical protein